MRTGIQGHEFHNRPANRRLDSLDECGDDERDRYIDLDS